MELAVGREEAELEETPQSVCCLQGCSRVQLPRLHDAPSPVPDSDPSYPQLSHWLGLPVSPATPRVSSAAAAPERWRGPEVAFQANSTEESTTEHVRLGLPLPFSLLFQPAVSLNCQRGAPIGRSRVRPRRALEGRRPSTHKSSVAWRPYAPPQ